MSTPQEINKKKACVVFSEEKCWKRNINMFFPKMKTTMYFLLVPVYFWFDKNRCFRGPQALDFFFPSL